MYYNYQKESDNVVMSRFSGIVKQFFNYFSVSNLRRRTFNMLMSKVVKITCR